MSLKGVIIADEVNPWEERSKTKQDLFNKQINSEAAKFYEEELLERDVAFKQKFYYAKGAHYETATLSSIELLPKEAVFDALQEDYQAMKNMIYGNIPEFKEILEFLEKLQKEIHELK